MINIHGFKSDNFVGVSWWEGLDSAMAEVRLIGSLSMEEERLQIYIYSKYKAVGVLFPIGNN